MSITNPLTDAQTLLIKVIVGASLIIASIFYVNHLHSEIASRDTTIATLQGQLTTQNQATIDAGASRDALQGAVDYTVKYNNSLVTKNDALVQQIANRPTSKTCDEAIINLATTAKSVADKWNSK